MLTMLYTGCLHYESFYDSPEDDPIAAGRLFDISTPDKEKIARVIVLKQNVDYLEITYRRPEEPRISLHDIHDERKVKQTQDAYDAAVSKYQAEEALCSRVQRFVETDFETIIQEFSYDDIAEFWKIYTDYYDKTSEEYSRIYYFEVE